MFQERVVTGYIAHMETAGLFGIGCFRTREQAEKLCCPGSKIIEVDLTQHIHNFGTQGGGQFVFFSDRDRSYYPLSEKLLAE